MAGCWSTGSYVRGIKIIFARDADEREQGVATRVGQGSAHAMRARHVGNETDRPIRGDPFTRGMREHCGQIDEARCLVDGRGLHGCDLMLTEGFADDIETARERRIAKGAFLLARSCSPPPNAEQHAVLLIGISSNLPMLRVLASPPSAYLRQAKVSSADLRSA